MFVPRFKRIAHPILPNRTNGTKYESKDSSSTMVHSRTAIII